MSELPLRFKAGAASLCITPHEPLWLAGYAVRTAPREKISELYASALVLEDDTGERMVLASLEVIAVNAKLFDRVANSVFTRHRIPRERLLLTATHTHYGPEFRPDKALFFHIPDEYAAKIPAVADRLADATVRVIDDAISRLEPVRLFARKTSAGFAHNRRRRGVKAGKPSTHDTVDHDVPVLDCVNAQGNRKAIVFGYACHCTTIPPEDSRYCGDWAGFAKERLQRANPGATALFIPGPGADQDPEPRASLELSRQYGDELANRVQDALNQPGREISGQIRIAREDVSLSLAPVSRATIQRMLETGDPPQHVKAKFLLDQLDRGESLIDSYSAPIQVVRFGSELLLIALSGEPVIDWAHNLKSEYERSAVTMNRSTGIPTPHSALPTPHSPLVWVAGYCNDVFEYIPTRRIQAEGGYEGGRANLWSAIPSPPTEDTEVRITDAICRLVARVGAED